MYVIIAGAGKVGSEMTRIFTQKKYDVVVIDKDPGICEALYSETGAMTINGSATSIRTLQRAGADKADAIICLMHHEADNIACALLAKSLEIPRIMARLINPAYEQAYKLAGVNTILRSVDLLINQILVEIEQPKTRKVITLRGGKAQVYTVRVPKGAKVIGMTISEITKQKNFPSECVFMGIDNEVSDEFSIPRGNYEVKEGDMIFLISKSEFIKQATDFLSKRS